jgi:hypothetical protein
MSKKKFDSSWVGSDTDRPDLIRLVMFLNLFYNLTLVILIEFNYI